MSFQSSLQPMLSWMKCIGVFLEYNRNSKRSSFYIATSFGAILFFINIFINLTAVALFIDDLGKPKSWEFFKSKRFTSTRVWCYLITAVNHVFMTIGSHLSLLMFGYSRKWLSLVEVLKKMEKNKVFDEKNYQRFRSIYVVGSRILVMTLVGICIVTLKFGFPDDEVPLVWKALIIFQSLTDVCMFSGGVMFCCLGWMAKIQFKILAVRVKEEAGCLNKVNDWKTKIETWRLHTYLISELVDKTSIFFGPFLLVLVTYSFVIMINSSFMIFTNILEEQLGRNDLSLYFALFVIQFSFFSFLVYVPHRLRESAILLSKQLRILELNTSELQDKVNFLVMEVLNSLPKITALGLFDVNPHLIPTLAGTTLTYLIILCQFQYAEK